MSFWTGSDYDGNKWSSLNTFKLERPRQEIKRAIYLVFLCCLKAFLPPRRKERKGRQESRTCLVVLSGLCVLTVQMLSFEVFQGRLISDGGIRSTIADASGSERYVGKSKHYAGVVCFFFTGCISRFRIFAENDEKGYYPGTVIY